ncbi:MAG: preprotein translocase subunit SecG [Bifidobacteriaceae bacterium]|jgi:preprotein translocase subunit SecG|nr:preprotein translocase subunit SecG [Bifidobacteriaceae bacterium]
MQILKIVLNVLVFITSLALTLLILLHKGQGGGLSDMFGGGLTSGAATSGVAERNLDRITVLIASIWIICIVAVGVIMRYFPES